MAHRPLRSKILAACVALAVPALSLVSSSSSAQAAPVVNGRSITICHATNARNIPYVEVTVDAAAVFLQGHDQHTGPVFSYDLPEGQPWGDIIPEFTLGDRTYPGLNLTENGLNRLNNRCYLAFG